MKAALILIANATEARLFRRDAATDPLIPLETLQQPEGRRHAGALGDDHLGHGASDHRPGGTSFEPRMDPKRKKHLQFAQQLSERVDQALAGGDYGHVMLFASCPFLGELKGQLSPGAKKALRAAIDIDLTSFGLGEIEQRIERELHATHERP